MTAAERAREAYNIRASIEASNLTTSDWALAADLLAWSERLEDVVVSFPDFQEQLREEENAQGIKLELTA